MPAELLKLGHGLPKGWRSHIVGEIQGVELKLFKLDEAGLPEECHPAYDEGLLVIEGALQLEIDGIVLEMRTGDYQTIPAGKPHRILPGCSGTMLLLDPEAMFLSSSDGAGSSRSAAG